MRPRGRQVPSGLAITVGLAVLAILTRLPFASTMLYSYDSANYAFAIRDYYHVGHHHPHPPGYPLYVGTAWLLSQGLGDPNRGLVAVSILMSAIAVAATHRLAVAQFGGAIGLASALLLLCSSGLWGYGEVAYPYTALAGFGAWIALATYAIRGDTRRAARSGALFGIAAGFRWDLLIELSPLWALGLLSCSWRSRLIAAAALGAVCAAWAVPMVQLSGGLGEYLSALRAQSGYIVGAYSVVSGGETIARYNADLILQYLRLAVGVPLIILVYAIGRTLTPARLASDDRLRFLLLWIVPPAAVFLFLHIGDAGYVLVILPALSILAAVTLADLGADLRQAAALVATATSKSFGLALRRLAAGVPAAILVGLLAWNVNTFLNAPGPTRRLEIAHIDRLLETQVGFIQRDLAPEATVILAHDRFRQLQYYLTGYRVVLLFDEYEGDYRDRRRSMELPEGTTSVVVADSTPALGPRATAQATNVQLYEGLGGTIRVVRVDENDSLEYGYGLVELVRG